MLKKEIFGLMVVLLIIFYKENEVKGKQEIGASMVFGASRVSSITPREFHFLGGVKAEYSYFFNDNFGIGILPGLYFVFFENSGLRMDMLAFPVGINFRIPFENGFLLYFSPFGGMVWMELSFEECRSSYSYSSCYYKREIKLDSSVGIIFGGMMGIMVPIMPNFFIKIGGEYVVSRFEQFSNVSNFGLNMGIVARW